MTAIPGTILAAKVTTGDTATTFAVADQIEINGGLKSVADATARTAIPTTRLLAGDLCYQQDTGHYYKWTGSAWSDLGTTLGGSRTDGLSGRLPGSVSNGTTPVSIYMPFAGTVTLLASQVSAGTATITAAINGTAITGLSVSASTTRATGTPSGGNTFATGDVLAITVASASGASDLDFAFVFSVP